MRKLGDPGVCETVSADHDVYDKVSGTVDAGGGENMALRLSDSAAVVLSAWDWGCVAVRL